MFAALLLLGGAGMLLSFTRARSRAVFLQDGFAQPGKRAFIVALLAVVLLLTVLLPFAGGLAGVEPEARELSLVSVFAVHAILLFFLLSYYTLSRRGSLLEFLRIKSSRPVAHLSEGILIGAGGWLLTILVFFVFALFWFFLRPPSVAERGTPSVPPMILWLVAQPLWVKIAIVLSAMIVEEAFFRAFLQTRVGPLAATLMFTAAHGVYGQPLMLLGILVISAVLSATYAAYGNLLPCIVAHGTFDSIQMFVVIPLALEAVGAR